MEDTVKKIENVKQIAIKHNQIMNLFEKLEKDRNVMNKHGEEYRRIKELLKVKAPTL